MEIDQRQINKIQQEGFDEETKQKIQACMDEIDIKQQQKIPYKTNIYQINHYLRTLLTLIH